MTKIQMKAVYKQPLGEVVQDLLVDYDKNDVINWVVANYALSIPNAMLVVRSVLEIAEAVNE